VQLTIGKPPGRISLEGAPASALMFNASCVLNWLMIPMNEETRCALSISASSVTRDNSSACFDV
jgi:hypothetical protein